MLNTLKLRSAWGRLTRLSLFKNLSWLLLSEGLGRLSRIATLFVLAACFSNADYGLAMLALVIHELFRVFTRLGTGAKIIQCDQAKLASTLQNAATLQWLVAIAVAVAQIALSSAIAAFYQQALLAELLQWMALAHLFYPMVSVRIFEQQRRNRFRYYGIASGACIAFENLSVAALVFLNGDIMMVALAKVAAAIFWVALFLPLPTAMRHCAWQWQEQKALIRFSFSTLFSELSRMLRFQADVLIAGRLLSPELLGLYSFAKSAGLGIAQSLSQAYLSALYPHLCERVRAAKQAQAHSQTQAQTAKGLHKFSLAFAGMLTLQAAAALVYVDVLFAERWQQAASLTALLCLVAVPNLLIDQIGLVLRAQDQAGKELMLIFAGTVLVVISLLALQASSPQTMALGLLVSTSVFCVLALLLPRLKRSLSRVSKGQRLGTRFGTRLGARVGTKAHEKGTLLSP